MITIETVSDNKGNALRKKLKLAIQRRNRQLLQKLIIQFEEMGLDDREGDVEKGKSILQMLKIVDGRLIYDVVMQMEYWYASKNPNYSNQFHKCVVVYFHVMLY